MNVIKQVIIVRTDLNMRKGKMIAQGAHASIKAYDNAYSEMGELSHNLAIDWFFNQQTKIVVGVDSEQELKDLYNKALQENLPAALILDAGKTEFKESTYTAVAIGPADEESINAITGELKLL